MSRGPRWAAGGLLVLLLGTPAAADVRRVEAVGAVPLAEGELPAQPPRDAAMRVALLEAVWRVALEELPGFDADARADELEAALGSDPLEYATRFRVVDDRGERPALFTQGGEARTEYVVVTEVYVDADRVRRALTAHGLLRAAPSGGGQRHRVRLVLEDVDHYGSYRAVKTLLDELGVHSAVPVELVRGRVVLEVDGSRRPRQLLDALLRAAPPELTLVPLGTEGDTVRLRARFSGAPAAPDRGAAFDTQKRNRY